MTKHESSASPELRDRPDYLVCEIGCVLQTSEGVTESGMETLERRKNGLPLQGLAIAKAYLKGDVLLYAVFKRDVDKVPRGCVGVANQGEASDNLQVFHNEMLESHFLHGGQEVGVLVGDVEGVDCVKVAAIPSWKRLYYVDDVIDDSSVWQSSSVGISFNGGIKPLPRPVERKLGVPINDHPVGFDQYAVSVVEGGSEVVDCVSQDRRSVPGESFPKLVGDLPSLTIELRSHSLLVRSLVGAENTFEFVDVMLGPIGL